MSDFPKHRNPRLNIVSENPTHSKDLLVRNVFERSEKTSALCGYELCSLATEGTQVTTLSLRLSKNVFEELRDDKRLA